MGYIFNFITAGRWILAKMAGQQRCTINEYEKLPSALCSLLTQIGSKIQDYILASYRADARVPVFSNRDLVARYNITRTSSYQ
jgi:hypothetical protein